ncbi:ubiquitin carboxyl-terminal hydrolase [Massariosphaeria phaeospora]|uniref:Ubiquitin carboxyl-terminal hydrolase n=1 Tax=Massariosphaeria phaeospora TaxID=100035 RepID=A0A7C8M7U3_9PLEO|nr:ubiquitin carboxyl-terminal hydrolase [Massariosphaeria phaeospora]
MVSTRSAGRGQQQAADAAATKPIHKASTEDRDVDPELKPTVSNEVTAQEIVQVTKKRALPTAADEAGPSGKKAKSTSPEPVAFPSPPEQPATDMDKTTWQGFCEIESEPAYLTTILHDIGVQDVAVSEAFSMDPGCLATLPQPIYGLILLFRFRKVAQHNEVKECPNNLWFANQLPAQNSCATLAMINTVLNQPSLDIGEHLRQFKDFSKDLTPYQRGEAFASFQFVKKIHNSFATKMDILENDKSVAKKVEKANKAPRIKDARRSSEDTTATDSSSESLEDAAHHFIAFVPVGGDVWKLDGMDAQPTKMASFDEAAGEAWTTAIADDISGVMAAGDNDYNLLAVTQAPVAALRKRACLSVNTARLVESSLDAAEAGWRAFTFEGQIPPMSPAILAQMGIFDEQLAGAPVDEDTKAAIAGEGMEALLERLEQLAGDQQDVLAKYWDVKGEEDAAAEKAAERRAWDFVPAIKRWLEMLAENGHLAANLPNFKEE